jgi:hypothetical protein
MTHIRNAQLELEAAFDLGEVPPFDTLDRSMWRARFSLATLYTIEDIDDGKETALSDLLTDLLHYAIVEGVSFDRALSRAEHMQVQELNDWGIVPAAIGRRLGRSLDLLDPDEREI